ncbi:MAG UNVERIFIED_CONTAM: hypothetical protein LVQ98_01680 [Rickettsiaceae bacterium]|jgi:hypothetical protein
MQNTVEDYVISSSSTKLVKDIEDSLFQPTKVIAIVLDGMSKGEGIGELKKKADAAITKIEEAMHSQFKKDFIRDGIMIGEDNFKDIESIKEKIALTGEQLSYISHLATQSMVGDGGGATILSKMCGDQKFLSDTKDGYSYKVSVEDRRVILSSQKHYYLNDINNPISISQLTEDDKKKLPTITSTLSIDITDLKGETFKLGRTSVTPPISVEFTTKNEQYRDTYLTKIKLEAKKSQYMPLAKKLVEYANAVVPSQVKAYETIHSLIPKDQNNEPKIKWEDFGPIYRAATESKRLSFGDRVKKVFDKVSIALSITPKEIADLAKVAREEKNKAKPQRTSLLDRFRGKKTNTGRER